LKKSLLYVISNMLSLKSFLITTYNINKITIILQILTIIVYMDYPYLTLLYCYIVLIEYFIIDIYKTIKSYNYYLAIKLLFVSVLLFNNLEYSALFIITSFQFFLYFYNQSNLVIYKQKVNLYISSIALSLLLLFSINTTIYDIFLVYPIVYLLLVFIKSIHTTNLFCVKNEFVKNRYIIKLQQIPISFFLFTSILYIKLFTIMQFNTYSAGLFFITILFSLNIEKDNYKNNIAFISQYTFPIILVIVVMVIKYIHSISIESSSYSDYSSSIFSAITSIAILNIASLFVLVQLNYQKFASSYLLKKVFISPILLLIAFTPSIILILNVYWLNVSDIVYLPTLLLITAFFSTFMLFIYVYFILDTNIIIMNLFRDSKIADFENYKRNIINQNEVHIDTIAKIISTVIKNNDTTTSHSLFYNLACWLKINIHLINNHSRANFRYSNEKFDDFFMMLIYNISNSKDIVIHQNFIYSIQGIIMRKINSNNFYSYAILYKFLFKYLYIMLQNKEEEIAKEIYRVIYFNSTKILLGLPECKIEKYDMVRFNKEFNNYKDIFVDKMDKIINISISKQNISFLKSLDYYDKLFTMGYSEMNTRKKWDGKVFDIFTHTRYQRDKLDKYLIDNNISFFYIVDDYKIFLPYYHMSEKNELYIYDDIIQNYVIDRLVSIFSFAISKDKINNDHDLEIIWEQLYGAIQYKDIVIFKIYITLYTYLMDKLCEQNKDNIISSYAVKSIWTRLTYIFDDNNTLTILPIEFKEFMNEKLELLKKKYPKLNDFSNLQNRYQRISEIDILENYTIKL